MVDSVQAQSLTETKIRLMADALRARDSGDLELAQRNLEELSQMAPDDPAIERLLKNVKEDLAAEEARLNPSQSDATTTELTSGPSGPVTSAGADPFASSSVGADPMAEVAVMEAEIEAAAAAEEARQLDLIKAAREQSFEASRLAETGRTEAAIAQLDSAIWSMPKNPLTAPVIVELTAQRADLVSVQQAAAVIERSAPTVSVQVDEPVSETDALWAQARSAYSAGYWEQARSAIDELLTIDPNHSAGLRLAERIDDELEADPLLWRRETRRSLIAEVEQSWRRPGAAASASDDSEFGATGLNPLMQKLAEIKIPSVSFSGVELHRVVSTLSDLSREFDEGSIAAKGVNIIVIDPQDRRPTVSLTLRDLSLKRVLDFITDSIGYQYEVQADAVVMRPGGETSTLDTEFFPITRSTVIRMTGIGGGAGFRRKQCGG